MKKKDDRKVKFLAGAVDEELKDMELRARVELGKEKTQEIKDVDNHA